MTVQFVPLKLRSLVPAEPSALTDIFNVIINAYNAFGLSVSQSSVTVNSLGSWDWCHGLFFKWSVAGV